MSMDPSGARLVTGSYDYDLKIWDFGGMKSDFKPFRSFESRAGHQVSLTLTFLKRERKGERVIADARDGRG